MQHALTTSGPPALFSSLVLVAGLLSMTLNQLLVLRDMGIVAAFTMAFAVLNDLLLGPATYHLLHRNTKMPSVAATSELPTARLDEVLKQTVELRLPAAASVGVSADGWCITETVRLKPAVALANATAQTAELKADQVDAPSQSATYPVPDLAPVPTRLTPGP